MNLLSESVGEKNDPVIPLHIAHLLLQVKGNLLHDRFFSSDQNVDREPQQLAVVLARADTPL